MANHEQELSTAIREVLKRSVVDPDFRQLATKNSSAALEKVSSRKDLANAAQITFIDNYGKTQKTIVLPDPIASPELLTEEDLEQVAGGCTATSCGTSA